MAKETEGYKGHRVGSNKGKVHQVFDEKGKDAAIKKAEALDIQTSTARTWCSTWSKGKASKKKAAAPAKTAKKAAPKKAAAPAKKPAAKKAVKRETMESASA